MTTTTPKAERLAQRAHQYMMKAQELLDAGFCTKAAQQSAMNALNYAYDQTREIVHDMAIDAARAAAPGWDKVQVGNDPIWQSYLAALDRYNLPFGLHQVRAKHLAAINDFAPGCANIIRELRDMRAEVKDTPITPIIKDSTKERVAAIRRDLIEEIAKRREQYVEALDMGRKFGGLPVTVNAHWVRHEQGTMFLRHYFYLRGVLTPLQVLLAAADTLERERAEREA